MKNFIVIFREPDGRTIEHSEEEIKLHQLNWKSWLEKTGSSGKLKRRQWLNPQWKHDNTGWCYP